MCIKSKEDETESGEGGSKLRVISIYIYYVSSRSRFKATSLAWVSLNTNIG